MLSKLVKEGTITQEKSDEILKQYEAFIASQELQVLEKKSLLELVEDKVMTQGEADAIKEALHDKLQEKKKQGKLDKENRVKAVKEALYGLVEDGILTQEKLNEIIKYHEERMAKIKEMKKDDDFWNELVTKGIITDLWILIPLYFIPYNFYKNNIHIILNVVHVSEDFHFDYTYMV